MYLEGDKGRGGGKDRGQLSGGTNILGKQPWAMTTTQIEDAHHDHYEAFCTAYTASATGGLGKPNSNVFHTP